MSDQSNIIPVEPGGADLATRLLNDRRPKRLPEVGQVRVGEKVGGSGRPRLLDHFRIVSHYENKQPIYNDALERILDPEWEKHGGPKVRSIPIMFVGPEVAHNLYEDYRFYPDGQMRCQGNGETARMQRRHQDGNWLELWTERKCLCDFYHQGIEVESKRGGTYCVRCKLYWRLSFIITEDPYFGGVYVLRSTSQHGEGHVRSVMEKVYQTCGTLLGQPFRLHVKPKSITRPEGGKRVKATMPMVYLEYVAEEGQSAVESMLFRAQKIQGQLLGARGLKQQVESNAVANLEMLDDADRDPEQQREFADEFVHEGRLPKGKRLDMTIETPEEFVTDEAPPAPDEWPFRLSEDAPDQLEPPDPETLSRIQNGLMILDYGPKEAEAMLKGCDWKWSNMLAAIGATLDQQNAE